MDAPGPSSVRFEIHIPPRELRNITTVLAEEPVIIDGQAFTSGRIKRNSIERVLSQTWVEFGIKDGLGCDSSKYLPAEMAGKTVPDEHIHEHATCFHVKDLGLVVISSCGHVGIIRRHGLERQGKEQHRRGLDPIFQKVRKQVAKEIAEVDDALLACQREHDLAPTSMPGRSWRIR